ncbi:TAP-like protein-domain-containing protein [Mrakia frigida]|uniref:TAP-like protein-domain-containing protein n=1 Tax=Mrakia frigida TaxID=29902 RepID=UPI003FCC2662
MGNSDPFEPLTIIKKRNALPFILLLLPLSLLLSHCHLNFLVLPPSFFGHPRSSDAPSSSIWKPCDENPALMCTFLDVPTDYLNVSFGTTTLAVSRFPSSFPPSSPRYKGAIFINPGGPGGSGRSANFGLGPLISSLVLGSYDIIGHDPRGIGLTTPQTKCFSSDRALQLFRANTRLERMFDLPPDPFSVEGRNELIEQQREVIALWETEYKLCNELMGEELKFMGTSQAAKDIERMAEVLGGKDALINFWGFSYGTVMGGYLVNMISPKKLGRVIIDGVASPPQWATQHKEAFLYQALTDTEKTYQEWFLDGCFLAGSKRCALVLSTDESGKDIASRIDDFLDELYLAPISVVNSTRPGLFTSGGLRAQIMENNISPHGWSSFARTLASILSNPSPNNPSLLSLYAASHSPILPPSSPNSTMSSPLGRIAVSCADSIPYDSNPTAESMVDETLQIVKDVTRRFGASVQLMEQDGGCWLWEATGKAKDVFRGPFNAILDTPMLILSNTADPVTPLASGQEMASLMGSSARLLVQDAPGHCSLSAASLCTAKHVRAFFLDDTLPPKHTVCPIDDDFFPSSEIELSTVSIGQRFASSDDLDLWRTSRDLKEAWSSWRENEAASLS